MVLSEKEWGILGDAYQRRSDEISRRISAEFPEFSRMDVAYLRNFIQENEIPLETALKNVRHSPMGYVNRIKYSYQIESCHICDNELAIIKKLLNVFDKREVIEFITESLDKNKALWKVIADKSDKLNKETADYLSAEY